MQPVYTVALVPNVRAAVYTTAAPGRYLIAVEEAAQCCLS